MSDDPRIRPTDADRQAVRNEMHQSTQKLEKKLAGSLFATFVAHVQGPDGKVFRDFGAMVDGATNGLLTKAIKGMMAPDEPKPASDIKVTVKPNEKH